jgi:hypothetical protein
MKMRVNLCAATTATGELNVIISDADSGDYRMTPGLEFSFNPALADARKRTI